MNDTHTEQQHSEDQIRADRACVGCGFNLFGQTVTREEHYGLAIARCPECGTVAALQQYPSMTHWVNRFRMIIAAIYVFLLFAFFAGSTVGISGFAFGASSVASENLRRHLGDSHQAWNELQNTQQATTNGIPFYSSFLSQEYIEEELPSVIEEFGPLWGNMDPEWVIVLVPAVVVCFAIGSFWSVVLLGSTRKRAILLPLISCVIGCAFILAANRPDYNSAYIWNLAHQLYIPSMTPVVLLIELIALACGIWLGRSIARFAVRIALPARARVPFSILWTRDGLKLPRP
jgi:hypothetical protein